MISRRNWRLFHSKLLPEGILQFSKIIGYYIIIYIYSIWLNITSVGYIFPYIFHIYSIYIPYIFHIINLQQYPHDYRSNPRLVRPHHRSASTPPWQRSEKPGRRHLDPAVNHPSNPPSCSRKGSTLVPHFQTKPSGSYP